MIRPLLRVDASRRPPRIGPKDSGRYLTLEEFQRAKGEPGYVYEIIDGILIVSPNPTPLHDYWVTLAADELTAYAKRHPKVINWVSTSSEVVIPARPGATRPQPDIAAYKDYPKPFPPAWDDVCPLVVVEAISPRRAYKDTVRNRHLYWLAGGVQEYLILDPQDDAHRPTLIGLYKRPGAADWDEKIVSFGKSYRSRVLPGFVLNLNRLSKSE